MSDGRYMPLVTPGGDVAGSYRFVYDRLIQDYPCDADGFVVSVDAVNGEITEYRQHWQTPDNAFMIAEVAVVPRYDATSTIQAKAKAIYPSSVTSLRIISADIRWKDQHDPQPSRGRDPFRWHGRLSSTTISSGQRRMPYPPSAGLMHSQERCWSFDVPALKPALQFF